MLETFCYLKKKILIFFFFWNGEVTKNDCSAVWATEAFHERFECIKVKICK